MRTFLDGLYKGSGALAALGIVGITLLILAQIIGRWLGIIVPSVEDFSGFLLAGSSLLGLAYTLRHGVHIRVSLLFPLVPESLQRPLEIGVLLLASSLCVWMSWYFGYMTYESWLFNDISHGYIPVALWLVQLFPSLGLVIFTIALLDDLIAALMGRPTSYQLAEEKANAEHQPHLEQ